MLRNAILFLSASATLAGCVQVGGIDPAVVNRYQEAMVRKGPQKRLGSEGVAQLRPAPGTTGPELKVQTVQDETGKPRARIPLSLDEAVMRALANNLDIRVVGYDPAISREEMVKAAAAFDFTVFGGAGYSKEDKKRAVAFQSSQSRVGEYELGVREHTPIGTDWSLAWTLTRTADNSTFSSMPVRYEPMLALSATQPLLRNAWPEFNLAQLRVARINTKMSESQFRAEVERVIGEVVSTYWELWRARREVEIYSRSLDEAVDVRDKVRKQLAEGRATEHVLAQAEAEVKNREALLIQAKRKWVPDWRDRLARLLADAQLAELSGADYDIEPVTSPLQGPMALDATDQLLTALRCNPLLEQARLAISLADVNVRVAENQTLPKLDLTASTGLHGMGASLGGGDDALFTGKYASYSVGLMLEYPIGNREAMAELRRSRLARQKSVAQMQSAADRVALDVRERIHQIDAYYAVMQAQDAALKSARRYADGWKVLTSPEQGLRMDSSNLFLALQAQETALGAEREYVSTILMYNQSMVELVRATGTLLELHHVKLAPASGEAAWPAPTVPPPSPPTAPSATAPATTRP